MFSAVHGATVQPGFGEAPPWNASLFSRTGNGNGAPVQGGLGQAARPLPSPPLQSQSTWWNTPLSANASILTETADRKKRRDDARLALEEGRDTECPVCLDSFAGGTAVLLPCDHYLCALCITKVAVTRRPGAAKCPLCRAKICSGTLDEMEAVLVPKDQSVLKPSKHGSCA